MLNIPYSNGFAGTVLTSKEEGKVLFGMSAETAVGLFEYNHNTGTTSKTPLITTQGAPSVVYEFK